MSQAKIDSKQKMLKILRVKNGWIIVPHRHLDYDCNLPEFVAESPAKLIDLLYYWSEEQEKMESL